MLRLPGIRVVRTPELLREDNLSGKYLACRVHSIALRHCWQLRRCGGIHMEVEKCVEWQWLRYMSTLKEHARIRCQNGQAIALYTPPVS